MMCGAGVAAAGGDRNLVEESFEAVERIGVEQQLPRSRFPVVRIGQAGYRVESSTQR